MYSIADIEGNWKCGAIKHTQFQGSCGPSLKTQNVTQIYLQPMRQFCLIPTFFLRSELYSLNRSLTYFVNSTTDSVLRISCLILSKLWVAVFATHNF